MLKSLKKLGRLAIGVVTFALCLLAVPGFVAIFSIMGNHGAIATPIVSHRDVPVEAGASIKVLVPPKAPFSVDLGHAFVTKPTLSYWGVRKVSKPYFIRVPGENRLLRYSYEDFVVAVYTAFYEARGSRGPNNIGIICTVESLITRAFHRDHPDTIVGAAFEKRKVEVKNKEGKVVKILHLHMYSPYDDPKKRRGYYDPEEHEVFLEVAAVVSDYFDGLSRGIRNERCEGVYAFHSTKITPPLFFRRKCELAVTVPSRGPKRPGQKYYRLKG